MRIDGITKDLHSATQGVDVKVHGILDGATSLVKSAQNEVEVTGSKIREKLELVDELLASSSSVVNKIDQDKGTLGRLVNDSTLADNLEEVTEDAKGFLGSIFRMQTYVGLRSEYNILARLARSYLTIEVATRPDKFYYIEIEKGPRGGSPNVTLEFDPTIDRTNWIRRVSIEDDIRFSFQFGRRYKWASFRFGIKESTGGVGVDGRWFEDRLNVSVDLFDASFDDLPRLKVTAAFQLFQYIYILGGVDELLNSPTELLVDTGNTDVPRQFDTFRFGRDYFLGAMLRFNDRDLAALLTVGGASVAAAAD